MRTLLLCLVVPVSGGAAAGPAWVGSEVCRDCHSGIYRSYFATPMSRSAGSAAALPSGAKFDKAAFSDSRSGYSYRVAVEGGESFLYFRKNDGTIDARRKLAYFVGSGASASSFLLSVDGFLYEAPVTYYSGAGEWRFSPGYDRYSYPFLTRAIAPGCLACHASRLQPVEGTQNGYLDPPFLEGGVSCERCHGPGGVHADRMRAGDRAHGSGIVNPARLDPERRDSVCNQCHLAGDIRVERAGASMANFVAGDRLSDYAAVFVRAGESGMRVTSHAENLAQSGCKRVSGDRLWCGSCHDPHVRPGPAEKAAWFNGKCLNCHAASACTESESVRRSNNDNCTACHMPKNPAGDADHVVYTNHSIQRRPGASRTAASQAVLLPFGRSAPGPRESGLAYAIVGLREGSSAYRTRAFGLLREALRTNPEDPQALSYLADLYNGRGDADNAVRLYEKLWSIDQTGASAPTVLGGRQMEQGNLEAAIALWRAALRANPALVLVRANLAVALLRTGRPAEARKVLEKALEFNPAFQGARDLYAQIPPPRP